MTRWSLARDDRESQDLRDGAAIRRLREALPETHHIHCVGPNRRLPDHLWWIYVEDEELGVIANAEAPTIAEAADKCREAMG